MAPVAANYHCRLSTSSSAETIAPRYSFMITIIAETAGTNGRFETNPLIDSGRNDVSTTMIYMQDVGQT